MTLIFIEGNKCNSINIKKLKPYEDTHREPTEHEYYWASNIFRNQFVPYINSSAFTNSFVGQMFRYRIGTRQSLVQNIYEFLSILVFKDINFVYSPDKGIALWPFELGFFRNKFLEQTLHAKEAIFFVDYISETTTFLRFHFKFRFGNLIKKKEFLQSCIHSLLYYASLENRFHLMRDIIQLVLKMILLSKV